MASYEVELMRRKQKLSWDIFSHGLHLKASLPGKRIRTAPSWHQKGGSRPVAENSGTFYSPNPPFIYHWKLGHGGGGSYTVHASQDYNLPTRAALLHLSIGQIFIVPLPRRSAGPRAEAPAVNKAKALLWETSQYNGSDRQGQTHTHFQIVGIPSRRRWHGRLASPGRVRRESFSQEVSF